MRTKPRMLPFSICFACDGSLQDISAADDPDGPIIDFDRIDDRADIALAGVDVRVLELFVHQRASASIFETSIVAVMPDWARARSRAALARSRSDFRITGVRAGCRRVPRCHLRSSGRAASGGLRRHLPPAARYPSRGYRTRHRISEGRQFYRGRVDSLITQGATFNVCGLHHPLCLNSKRGGVITTKSQPRPQIKARTIRNHSRVSACLCKSYFPKVARHAE